MKIGSTEMMVLPAGVTPAWALGQDGSPVGIKFTEALIMRILYEGVELFAFEEGVSLEDASFIVDRDLTKPAPGYEVEISSVAGGPLTEEESTERRDRAIRSLSTRQMYALCWSLSPKDLAKPETFEEEEATFTGSFEPFPAFFAGRLILAAKPKDPRSWVSAKPWLRKRKGGAA